MKTKNRILVIAVKIIALACLFLIAGKVLSETKEVTERGNDFRYEGIVCWGDSLTAGAGGKAVNYPAELKKLLKRSQD